MQQNYQAIRSAGLGLAAISYDSPAVLKDFAARKSIQFPLLSDADSKIIQSFDILSTEPKKGTPFYGIPYPGIYIVDPHGIVTAKYFENNYVDRNTAGLILLRQFGIQPETHSTPVEAKHLQLSVSATSDQARMGEHIALVLDVHLADRTHVYAPGVKGYIPIDWHLVDSPAVTSASAAYPEAKLLHLEAINETVPVYDGEFRLSRDIIIASDKVITPLLDAQGNFVVEASFRYQACDDRQCFIPETVPLKWVLHFDHLDRTRPPDNIQRKLN